MNEIIQRAEVSAYTVPTDLPESDGTLEWHSTTMVIVELEAGTVSGLGYSYTHESAALLIREKLFPLLRGRNPMDLGAIWPAMLAAVRNFGKWGLAIAAIAAVDIALWDLKARLLRVPLFKLLGAAREKIPVYGSGGFTSYTDKQLRAQVEDWAGEGISMVKMKIGRDADADPDRVKTARKAIGRNVSLFVDANGAFTPNQAIAFADKISEYNVGWFEEPVSSDDLEGLRSVRACAPAGMEISAGEYNSDVLQARRMLEARAVDVIQADATRCGATGFLQTAALCEAFQMPLSSHTAPALHAHLCCATARARHAEYFHDHVRIEQMFFEGATTAHNKGFLKPDPVEAGLGLQLKKRDTEKFRVKL